MANIWAHLYHTVISRIRDEEAAKVVRLIFTMAAEGKKKPEIARFLNGHGIPACMEHFQAIGLKRKSYREKEKKLWTVTTIGDMIKNEVYQGKTVWNKTRQSARSVRLKMTGLNGSS